MLNCLPVLLLRSLCPPPVHSSQGAIAVGNRCTLNDDPSTQWVSLGRIILDRAVVSVGVIIKLAITVSGDKFVAVFVGVTIRVTFGVTVGITTISL